VSGSYQPQWMRLGEAAAYLERSRSMSPQAAKDWLLRAIQDQLRADAERYQSQTMFRVAGFPTQWKYRGKPDWPARLTHDRIDWDASTINGQDPVRIISNDLVIEVSAAALVPGGITHAATPSGMQTNRRAELKAKCVAWIRSLPDRPPRRKDDVKADATAAIPGLSGRQFNAAWDEAAPALWKVPGPKDQIRSSS
jgi:hypothetical protein